MLFVWTTLAALVALIGWAALNSHELKENDRRTRQRLPPVKHHDVTDLDVREVYTVHYIPSDHPSGPSFADRCKGGQRPFGENAQTRAADRRKAESERQYW